MGRYGSLYPFFFFLFFHGYLLGFRVYLVINAGLNGLSAGFDSEFCGVRSKALLKRGFVLGWILARAFWMDGLASWQPGRLESGVDIPTAWRWRLACRGKKW